MPTCASPNVNQLAMDKSAATFTMIISGFSGGCKFFGGIEENLQLEPLRCLRRLWPTGKLTLPAEGAGFSGMGNTV